MSATFSIDQNCHSLWDVLPKLHALARRGAEVTHFIEDIDVAFTQAGAAVAPSGLRLAREQYHRGGIADWGAALFYSEFLGRLPMDVRNWEVYTGLKTSNLAKRLGCSVEELYDRYSPSDNWQLIGPSYVGDRDHHRTIADLTVNETAGFVREILAKARANCLHALPEPACQDRLIEWFDREQALVDSLLARCEQGRLVDLYRLWLGSYLGRGVKLQMTSSLFANHTDQARTALLEIFLRDYDQAAGLYNEAVSQSGVALRPLDTSQGELPFFAVLGHLGHNVRCAAYLDGNEIRIAQRSYRLPSDRALPLDAMAAGGITAVAGKALLLVIQARLGPAGAELAVPHRGSEYMTAEHCLARKLEAAGLLPGKLKPVRRVRFRLLEKMRDLEVTVRLPDHLRCYFGKDELPARAIGENYEALACQASERLERFKDPNFRSRWQRQRWPEVSREIDTLEQRRRQLAAEDPKGEEIRQLGRRQKQLSLQLLRGLVDQIALDAQMAEIDYWDSRGALLSWCVGLGGQELYNKLVNEAELYAETH